jgi:hypothetical protein
MLIVNKISQFQKERKLFQQHFVAALKIDTLIKSKIERGEHPAKRTHLVATAKILSADKTELLTFWFADKII